MHQKIAGERNQCKKHYDAEAPGPRTATGRIMFTFSCWPGFNPPDMARLEEEFGLVISPRLNGSFGMSFPLFFVFQAIGIMPPISAHAEC